MNETPSLRRDAPRRGGFTLIEVVIALAIFVFGALAIIRIFPPALGVIQNSGDRLAGTNLNKSLLATYEKQPDLVPYAIVDNTTDAALTNWRDSTPGSVAGTRRNDTLPIVNNQDFNTSALGHFKNIVGEGHTVPTTGVILTQFPYDAAVNPAIYREDTLDGVTIDNTGKLVLTNATRVSDNTPFTVTAGDIYYVSYRYTNSNRYWGVDDERLDLATTPVTAAANVVPGDVQVRVKTPLVMTTADNDPALGRIVVSSPVAGMKVSVDYRVIDWRWLVYDGYASSTPDSTIVAPATRAVTLPIHVLDSDQTTYFNAAFPAQDPKTTLIRATNADFAPADAVKIARTSSIPFNITTANPPQVRVTYLTADNWAQQLSVAAKYYTLYNASAVDKWRECVQSNAGGYLYFHPSEAGKTIQISYTYQGGSPSTPANDKTVVNRILTIDDDIIPVPGDVSVGSSFDTHVARLQLTDVNGDYLAATPITSIQKIKGISVQSRMAWLDGDRYTQISSTSFRGGDDQ